jgi:hypothetical protein
MRLGSIGRVAAPAASVKLKPDDFDRWRSAERDLRDLHLAVGDSELDDPVGRRVFPFGLDCLDPRVLRPHNPRNGLPIPIPLANRALNEDRARGGDPPWSGYR